MSNGLDRSCRATQSSCSRSRRWSRHRCWYATSRFVQGRIFVLRQTQNRRKPTAEKKQWITTWKETIVFWYAFQNHLKQTWTGSQLKAPNCKWKHKGFIQLNTCISKPEVNTSINMLLTWVIRCESCLATSCFTFLLSNLQERCYEKIVLKKKIPTTKTPYNPADNAAEAPTAQSRPPCSRPWTCQANGKGRRQNINHKKILLLARIWWCRS